ncbi:MAG: helix-turn-helix domain-containing protein [Bacteroidaceae bacterium]|nr:helix-turn-helix domain-containing protein [Bacteroidaceae bacterium]
MTQVPIVVSAAVGIATHSEFYGFDLTTYWQVAVMIVFVVYYIYALIQYGQWLRQNYADLEHKEVWQSLAFAAVLLVVYEVYFTNPGEMVKEYLAQIETLVIVVFLLWRVESLQTLPLTQQTHPQPLPMSEGSSHPNNRQTDGKQAEELSTPLPHREGQGGGSVGVGLSGIEEALLLYCEQQQLYLQYDLTLSELAEAVGMSREALSAWFAEHDDTYNAYINRLRIDHFVSLYREAVAAGRPATIFEVAHDCGYRSYLSFHTAFRQRMGMSVTAWIKS